MAASNHQYQPSVLDDIEEIEKYTRGGFHPIHIGDEFESRYKVIHKLAYGAFSTVWLAKDQVAERYVALKILANRLRPWSCTELVFLYKIKLLEENESTSHPGRRHLGGLLDNFVIVGPNGEHICLVLQVAGPSIAALNHAPVAGCRRLKARLARKAARQTVQAVDFVHSQGWCHGDLNDSNISFKLKDSVNTWSQEEIYACLGQPKTDEIKTISGSEPPGESAPKYVVQPCSLLHPQLLSEDILIVDFGSVFPIRIQGRQSNIDEIGITMPYAAPEVIFDSKWSIRSDIWALGCILFEFRSGAQLFGDWIGTKDDVLRQMVQAFGKLPEPWWTAWEGRGLFFDDDGEPKKDWDDGIVRANKFGLDEMIAEIGAKDGEEDDTESSWAEMLEPNGVGVPEEEASQMRELLERIMKFSPEDRISIKEIIDHPWLSQDT